MGKKQARENPAYACVRSRQQFISEQALDYSRGRCTAKSSEPGQLYCTGLLDGAELTGRLSAG